MSNSLVVSEAATIAECAFSPLRCEASSDDRKNELRINVFDILEEHVILEATLISTQFRNRRRFAAILAQLRSVVQERGQRLDQWSFPSAKKLHGLSAI